MHSPAAMKASGPDPTAPTTASERVIGNKACAYKHSCGQTNESITNHGRSSLLI
jgi:hypothetical protein